MEQELVSKVWRLSGLIGSVIPGVLVLNNGQVAFISSQGLEFNVPLAEIKDVKWPFLRMGLGFDATVNGEKYKFSFAKPNASAPEIDDTSGDQLLRTLHVRRFWDSIGTIRNLKTDKATTKSWKQILKG
jgi:hypothetical protein